MLVTDKELHRIVSSVRNLRTGRIYYQKDYVREITITYDRLLMIIQLKALLIMVVMKMCVKSLLIKIIRLLTIVVIVIGVMNSRLAVILGLFC